MQKNFDKWNEEKKRTHAEKCRLYTEREIWWCRLGINVGYEQDGSGQRFLRPVIILRSFGPYMCFVVPLTTSRTIHPLRFRVGLVDEKEATALISQMRIIDTRRLVEKVSFLDKTIFDELKNTIKGYL